MNLQKLTAMSIGLLEDMCEYAINPNVDYHQYPNRLYKAYLGVLALKNNLLSIESDLKASIEVGVGVKLLIDNTGEIIKSKKKLSFATSKAFVCSIPDIFYEEIDWEKLENILFVS